jgi:hypothetical protein
MLADGEALPLHGWIEWVKISGRASACRSPKAKARRDREAEKVKPI